MAIYFMEESEAWAMPISNKHINENSI